jgi:transitional endoplasmic reticulum ATPase
MRHFRKAMESVRATITDDLMNYYEDMQEEFKGGTQNRLTGGRQDGRIGFQ